MTSNPDVKTITDLTERDRIALPAVGVSMQSRLLQLASSKLWGDAQYNKLDRLQVALPHPEATAAILKGNSTISTHFSAPPFQEQELAGNPRARVLLTSYDPSAVRRPRRRCTRPRSSAATIRRPTRPSSRGWPRPRR